MMMARVDLNNVGLAAGSKTVADDWKDWKSPAISRERAKLFLKSTCEGGSIYIVVHLNETHHVRNGSIE